ncbi:hypothetical protein DD237_001104 [Peronospora effusa]|uniref:Uncharacterized protein n=1 Tax=Peronospora effusa TaxID=542832 RepID=A0A425CJU8_9STRA|nr:hypothetical protein DD237_001104 [Peronospora effusa]
MRQPIFRSKLRVNERCSLSSAIHDRLNSEERALALSMVKENADSYFKVESARDEGDRIHALVHAFYALQTLRMKLTTSDSSSVSALRLVCRHEEEKEAAVETCQPKKSMDKHSTKKKLTMEYALARNCCVSASKKDGILALLAAAARNDSIWKLYGALARGWLALNINYGTETKIGNSIHRATYWRGLCIGCRHSTPHWSIAGLLVTVCWLSWMLCELIEGPSVTAARALKKMAPVFSTNGGL